MLLPGCNWLQCYWTITRMSRCQLSSQSEKSLRVLVLQLGQLGDARWLCKGLDRAGVPNFANSPTFFNLPSVPLQSAEHWRRSDFAKSLCQVSSLLGHLGTWKRRPDSRSLRKSAKFHEATMRKWPRSSISGAPFRAVCDAIWTENDLETFWTSVSMCEQVWTLQVRD